MGGEAARKNSGGFSKSGLASLRTPLTRTRQAILGGSGSVWGSEMEAVRSRVERGRIAARVLRSLDHCSLACAPALSLCFSPLRSARHTQQSRTSRPHTQTDRTRHTAWGRQSRTTSTSGDAGERKREALFGRRSSLPFATEGACSSAQSTAAVCQAWAPLATCARCVPGPPLSRAREPRLCDVRRAAAQILTFSVCTTIVQESTSRATSRRASETTRLDFAPI